MNTAEVFSVEGGCTCRAVRYRVTAKPLFVHCCHCRWCQRETGASFALNAMIEADRVVLLHHGAVVAEGPREAFRASTDPHVMQFLTGAPEGPLAVPEAEAATAGLVAG